MFSGQEVLLSYRGQSAFLQLKTVPHHTALVLISSLSLIISLNMPPQNCNYSILSLNFPALGCKLSLDIPLLIRHDDQFYLLLPLSTLRSLHSIAESMAECNYCSALKAKGTPLAEKSICRKLSESQLKKFQS